MNNLSDLFKPKSVAIVGVSEDPTKLSSVLFSNMEEAGYKGKIYPVNPKYKEIYGLESFAKVSDIPGEVDLVCIAIPAPFVKDVVIDCANKKVKAIIVITAGFRETGAEGSKLEQEILDIAKSAGIRILGPNCLGMIIPQEKINASFAAASPKEGDIAFISQSGAFCTAMLDLSLEKNLGFSHFISLGNKSDISENELIESFLENSEVKVVGAYLEEVKKGRELMNLLSKEQNNKPIVMFKPGISDEAIAAISSHTGSIAGSVQTFKTAMAQSGVIEAKDINDMFYLMMAFSWSHLPKGNRVAVVTNAGGPGIIATDMLVARGLQMAKLSPETEDKLKKSLPATANTHNPIDLIGDALAERYLLPLDILIQDEGVDSILLILTPQLVTQIEDTAKVIINFARLSKKPILPVFIGGKYVISGLQRLYDKKIPAFRYLSDAVTVLAGMNQYSAYLNQKEHTHLDKKHDRKVKIEAEATARVLPEDKVLELAKQFGIDTPAQLVVSDSNTGLEFAKQHYPVVIKATNNAITHKSDVKGVYLNIATDEEFNTAFAELSATITKHSNNSRPQILIQEMIKGAAELFVGANRDGNSQVYEQGSEGFGHLLVFGQGGVNTEIYHDFAYAMLPVSAKDLQEEFASTKISKIMAGYRNQPVLSTAKFIETIVKLQEMLITYPEIVSIDINPVLVTTDRAVVVDMKVFVAK